MSHTCGSRPGSFALRSWAYLLLVIAAACMAALPASAERIKLKNGRIVEGWIVEENDVQVVVAIIREATVGKLTFRATDIDEIDRRRVESLEEALERARDERGRQERLRPAAITGTADVDEQGESAPVAGAPTTGSTALAEGADDAAASLFEPLTEEELQQVERLVRVLGDTRRAGGAAGRREQARQALVDMGPKVLPKLTEALQDATNIYRRMNASTAIGEISGADNRLALYEESVPRLLGLLSDAHPWVRISANGALERISGRAFGFPPEPTSWEGISRVEREATARWQAWWRDAQKTLGNKKRQGS
jgi:hypothetical protein